MTVSEFINKVGFKVKEEDVKKVNSTISDIKNTATKMLGVIGIGISLTQLNAIAEEFDGIGDRIAYAAGEAENLQEIQQNILNSANECRVAYGTFAEEVTSLKLANEGVFPLDDAATFVEYVNKLGKSAGYSDGEISSMQSSLQRIVATGQMASSDINRIARTTSALITTICNGLGVTREELDAMADAGSITADTIKQAMINSTDAIDDAFSNLNFGVGDALLQIRNKFGFWVDETNKMFNITQTIGKTMVKAFNAGISVMNKARTAVVWLSEKLGGTENLIKMIGIVGGTLLTVMNAGKILAFVKTIGTLLGGIKLKTLAIAAVIILVALLVEDFINFMQGNDSVLGTILEKAGIDTEKFRNNIIQIWQKAKVILGAIWIGIKNVAVPIFQGIWTVIKTVFTWIWNLIQKMAPGLAELVDELAAGKVDTAKWEKVGEVIAVIAGIILGVIVTLKVLSAVMAIVNAVMAVSPITWIILAIVALIAAIVLCIKNWDKIKAAFLKAWAAIKAAWSKVVDFFKGIWNGIVSVFKSVGSWFAEIFKSAWNGIKNAWNSVISFFKGIWSGISGAFKDVVSFFTNNFKKSWDAVKNIWNAVVGFFKSVWDGIVNVFKSVVSFFTSNFQKSWDGVKSVWSVVTGWFKSVWDGIVSVFSVVANWFSNIFSKALEGVKSVWSTVTGWFQGIWNSLTSTASSAINGIRNTVQSVWNAVSGIFSSVWNGISSTFSGIWNGMKNFVSSAMSGISSTISSVAGGISNTVSNIKNAIVNGFTNAINWIKALPAQALQWGKDIIQNIVNGINATIGRVTAAVSNVASKIKGYLGFSEPEDGPLSDFHTYMPDMIDLMYKGIEGGRSKLQGALEDIAGDMSVMASANYVGANTAAVAAGNSSVSKSVVQNVNINNAFHGDKAIQQSASKAMDNSATDITSQLARGLAYTG